ncbi:MAG TPA: endo alpha-1,4 polygalactosaminidase [Kofleriaceae bacterium]|nr:endo alpha-1,4 polygalactosaminidase [Kofleriaceae bacterium]
MRRAALLLAALACGDPAARPGAGNATPDADPGDDDPSAADGGAAAVWSPAPGTSWQWQLDGAIDTSYDVAMYDIDLVETPQRIIDELKADGRVVVCYFSAGSVESYRPDAGEFPPDAVGMTLDGWPDERWLDTRDPTVRSIMEARLDLAVARGCDGVEPDNVDAYANDSGFPLTAADQLDYNRFIAAAAHARNLSVGLKNDVEQAAALEPDFDWSLDEECFRYHECSELTAFIDAGKAVFHVEYGSSDRADIVCPSTSPLGFSTLIKRLRLDAWQVACP